jgi:hypothetical protein
VGFGASGIRTIKRKLAIFLQVLHKAFKEFLQLGNAATPIKLKTTEGVEVDFAYFLGKKNIVIEFSFII